MFRLSDFMQLYFSNLMHLVSLNCSISVSMEESVKGTSRGTIDLQLRGLDIKNLEPGLLGLGRSDPWFEISKKSIDTSVGVVRWYVANEFVDHPFMT